MLRLLFTGDIYQGNELFILSATLKKIFSEADLIIGNQEGPITKCDKYIDNKIVLKNSPRCIDSLINSGINYLTLANNHIMDYGVDGLNETQSLLKKNSIEYFGAGNTIIESSRPLIIKYGSIKLVFLFYCDENTGSKSASSINPGVNPFELDAVLKSIQYYNKFGFLIFIVVHWGFCDYNFPPYYIYEASEKLINAGATSIIGHHSHLLQGIRYTNNGGFIAYSLGNFYFAPFEHRGKLYITKGKNSKGGIISVDINKNKIVNLRLLNTFQDGNTVNYDSTKKTETYFIRLSKPLSNSFIFNYKYYWKIVVINRIIKRILYWMNPIKWSEIDINAIDGLKLMIKNILN